MKKILIVIVLLFFLPVCFVYAEPGAKKSRTPKTKLERRAKLDEFTEDIKITVGVVGIGSFFRMTQDKQKDYPSFISPNVGGIMRMVKPIMSKKFTITDNTGVTTPKETTLLDFGVYAYVTGGARKVDPSFITSIGLTSGLNNGFFSISIGPTIVLSDKGRFYWGIVFTSDSLKF